MMKLLNKPGYLGAILSLILGFILGVLLMFAIGFMVILIDEYILNKDHIEQPKDLRYVPRR